MPIVVMNKVRTVSIRMVKLFLIICTIFLLYLALKVIYIVNNAAQISDDSSLQAYISGFYGDFDEVDILTISTSDKYAAVLYSLPQENRGTIYGILLEELSIKGYYGTKQLLPIFEGLTAFTYDSLGANIDSHIVIVCGTAERPKNGYTLRRGNDIFGKVACSEYVCDFYYTNDTSPSVYFISSD